MAFGLGFVLGPLLAGVLARAAGRAGVAAAAAVPGRGRVLDARLGARADPAARVAAGRRDAPAGRAGPELARAGRHGPAARGSARWSCSGRSSVLGVRGARGDVQPVPAGALRLGARARGVRLRLPRAWSARVGAGGPDPPARPPVRRAAADRRPAWRRSPLGFAALAVVGSWPGAAGRDARRRGRPGAGQPDDLGPALAGHARQRAGGGLRHVSPRRRRSRRMVNYSVANLLLARHAARSAPYWEACAIAVVAWSVVRLVRLAVDRPTSATAMRRQPRRPRPQA